MRYALPFLLLCCLALSSCRVTLLRGGAKAPVAARQPLMVPVLHNGVEKYQVIRRDQFTRHGHTEEIPKGLIVDGASVPRSVWWFMPPDGLHRRAALCHDIPYALKGRFATWTMTRKQTDEMFYDFMIEDGVSKFRAGVAYRAVRMGGQRPWDNSPGRLTIAPVDDDTRLSARTQRPMTTRHLYE